MQLHNNKTKSIIMQAALWAQWCFEINANITCYPIPKAIPLAWLKM